MDEKDMKFRYAKQEAFAELGISATCIGSDGEYGWNIDVATVDFEKYPSASELVNKVNERALEILNKINHP